MYLDSSRLLRNKIAAPEFAILLSTMPRQKVKILIGKIDDARQKGQIEEKMKTYWGAAVGTLVLSSFFLERQGIWDRIERYVGIINVDHPIVGKVGRFDAKV